MQTKNRCAGSTTTAFILAFFLVVFTLVTVYLFVSKTWWFPETITPIGHEIDAQTQRTLWLTGIVFVLSQLGLAWVVWRYRNRGERARYSHGNNTLEVLWTLVTALAFIGLGVLAQFTWAKIHLAKPEPDSVVIEVLGEQFAWNFRYPGPDGKFGRTRTELINSGAGNPFGIDRSDPAAADDIVVPILNVPVNRPIELRLRSKDVIHSFFVRELRLKQDAVPGLEIPLRFVAERTGDFELVCTELCGMGHQRMRAPFSVKTAAEYEQWLRDELALLQSNP